MLSRFITQVLIDTTKINLVCRECIGVDAPISVDVSKVQDQIRSLGSLVKRQVQPLDAPMTSNDLGKFV